MLCKNAAWCDFNQEEHIYYDRTPKTDLLNYTAGICNVFWNSLVAKHSLLVECNKNIFSSKTWTLEVLRHWFSVKPCQSLRLGILSSEPFPLCLPSLSLTLVDPLFTFEIIMRYRWPLPSFDSEFWTVIFLSVSLNLLHMALHPCVSVCHVALSWEWPCGLQEFRKTYQS